MEEDSIIYAPFTTETPSETTYSRMNSKGGNSGNAIGNNNGGGNGNGNAYGIDGNQGKGKGNIGNNVGSLPISDGTIFLTLLLGVYLAFRLRK